MQKTLGLIRAFAREEDGVTAIEYGLLAALIAVAIIAGATLVGQNLEAVFQYIQGKLAGAIPAAPAAMIINDSELMSGLGLTSMTNG